jgi:WD40 repeat protein
VITYVLAKDGTWCPEGRHRHHAQMGGVRYSPDGALIASSCTGSVCIWDAATGTQRAVLAGHDAEVTDVAFSPDGTALATAGGDGTTLIWDATTGDAIATLAGLPGGGYATFLPDGSCQAADPGDSLWWAAGLPCCPPGELDLRRTGKRLK